MVIYNKISMPILIKYNRQSSSKLKQPLIQRQQSHQAKKNQTQATQNRPQAETPNPNQTLRINNNLPTKADIKQMTQMPGIIKITIVIMVTITEKENITKKEDIRIHSFEIFFHDCLVIYS